MTEQNNDPWADHKPVEKAIYAYAEGGCPFCGSTPEDFARYPVGIDLIGQTVACCEDCSHDHLVSISGYGVKKPDEEGTQWSQHDSAFFKLYPERQLHIREPFKQEAIILAQMRGMPEVDELFNAVLVVQFKPGKRGRLLCPFPFPREADEVGDEAIAAQTGNSVAELIATLSNMKGPTRKETIEAEREHGLAWTKLINVQQQ